MPISFEVLNQSFQVVVPILNNGFVYKRKQYEVKSPDGWTWVEISGNHVDILGPEIPNENDVDIALGYTYNNTIVFSNFDVAKRKWGMKCTHPLVFNSSPTFESIKAVIWEDKRAYWLEPNYCDVKCLEIKELEDLSGVKGITQELRSVHLYHALEREQIRQIEEAAKKKQAMEELMKSIPGRLKLTFERSGARMLNYSLTGNRIIVDWEIPGGNQYNSVIDSRTWQIVECGFCVSGDDKRHNITSMVVTAQEYEQKNLTYKTRET